MRDYRSAVGRPVLVHLDDVELAGRLVKETPTTLTLTEVTIATGNDPVAVDGQVIIERLRVSWVQVP